MKIRPLHDRLLVKRLEEQETTKGGIIIPDTAKEKPQEAEVVAVGDGKLDEEERAALREAIEANDEEKIVEGTAALEAAMQELATAAQYDIDVIYVVVDNAGWQSIRDLQMDAYGEDRGFANARGEEVDEEESPEGPAKHGHGGEQPRERNGKEEPGDPGVAGGAARCRGPAWAWPKPTTGRARLCRGEG